MIFSWIDKLIERMLGREDEDVKDFEITQEEIDEQLFKGLD
jgi:hypothetical protein